VAPRLPRLEALPSSLRARLTVTIVLASVVLFILVFGVTKFVILEQPHILGGADIVRYALPLGLGLVSMLLGLSLGLALERLIRRPIETFIRYMRDEGYRAIEGTPSQEPLVIDERLPEEFKDLGRVIRDLLSQLGVRQEALKRANEQAVAAEHAFRTVVNDSAEAKLLIRSGLVDLANPAAAACLGIPLGNILKQPVTALFEQMRMSTEVGEPLTADDLFELTLDRSATVRCDSSSHGERWMRVSLSESDAPGTYLLTARNITEEHRLEALRAEIVSLVSHDLRAPLTVIAGYLEMLDRPLEESERRKAAESAKTAANRMSSLLGDLLETTRAEQVFAPTAFRRVDLGALADDIAESMRIGSGHDITIVKKQEAIALGDELRLRQAIENLLGNAIKHTPDGTEITLTVDVIEDRPVVAVEDGGPGIPESRRKTVFDRFARLSNNEGVGGVGLGLYIVRVIAESHGGTVSVEDSSSGGARFVLAIPGAPRARRVKSVGQLVDDPQSDGSSSA
jgi:signal transduction histidine kinase